MEGIVTGPLTAAEIVERMERGYVEGVVAIPFDAALGRNRVLFGLDLSTALVGSPELRDVTWKVAGTLDGKVLLRVRGHTGLLASVNAFLAAQ